MLLYKNNGQLFSISQKALDLAGYSDIAQFLFEHEDYSELFLKSPGYIHQYETFSWISFLRNAAIDQKKVLISTREKKVFECDLELEKVYPVTFDAEMPEFFYKIDFINIRRIEEGIIEEERESEEILPSLKTTNTQKNDRINANHTLTNEFIPEKKQLEDDTPFLGQEPTRNLTIETLPPATENTTSDPANTEADDFADERSIENLLDNIDNDNKNIDAFDNSIETGHSFKLPLSADIIEKNDIIPEKEEKKETPEEIVFDIETAQDELIPVKKEPPLENTASDKMEAETLSLPDLKRTALSIGLPVSMVEDFIKEFIQEYHKKHSEIEAALASGFLYALHKEALTLKGVAANLGMEGLAQIFEEIMDTEDPKKLKSLWNGADLFIQRLENTVVEHSDTKSTQPPISSSDIPEFEEKMETIPSPEPRELELDTEKEYTKKLEFDPVEAASALGLPESLILDFTKDFVEQAEEEKENFRHAYANNELDEIHKTAHKLKGVAANLRIESMQRLMESVQYAKTLDETKEPLQEFYAMLSVFKKETFTQEQT